MDRTTSSPGRPNAAVEAGISKLYTEERRPMLRMATLMVGSVAVAEEIVQDAFAEVGARWDSLDRPGGYLRTSIVHGCARALRRQATEARLNRLEPVVPDVELPTRLLELHDALDQLSERQRIVVVLRYFVDLPDTQIAELLGVRPTTVRSLARRAFSVLRKELG